MQVLSLYSTIARCRIAFICTALSQFLLIPHSAAQQAEDETVSLQRLPIDGIRELGADRRNVGRTVTIRGTVTYSSPRRGRMFVQDETGGVQVYVVDRGLPDVEVGQQVEVTGRVTVSEQHKCASVRLDKLDRLGRADLPPVMHEAAAEFDPLDASGLLVEVRGVARNYSESSGHYYVKLVNSRREIVVAIPKPQDDGQQRFDAKWLGAKILVRGVWRARQGSTGLTYVLYPSMTETVQVFHAESLPPLLRAISDLDVLGKAASVNSRVRLQGRVTAVVGRWIYLADEAGEATVARLLSRRQVDVGNAVEVTGYVARDRETPYLIHASLNEVTAAESAAPLTAKLITMADSGQHVNELVELEGVVQDVIPSSDELLIRLRDGTARIWASAEAVREHTHVHRGDTLLVSGVMEQAASDSADHRLLLTSAPKTIQTGREVTSAATGFEDETDGATSEIWIWVVIGALACGGVLWVVFASRIRTLKEQRDTQQHLLTRVEELSHASRVNMLGDIVGALSHEINQPLTSVVNYAAATSETIKRLPALPHGEVSSLLKGIEDEAFRAGEIIRRLRDMSKKTIKGRTLVDINDLTQQTVIFYRAQFVCPQNLITLNLAASLPAVKVDAIQIQQVILNLLNNAREATEEIDGRVPAIQISTELDAEGQVQVIVEDNGSGPESKDLELLFRSFYTTKEQGMGVGLAICRLIAEVHSGSLQAELVAPTGCRMRLTLPVEKPVAGVT